MPRLAVIKGDGIGPEVIDQALKALDAIEGVFRPRVEVELLPYGAEHFLATGETLPATEMQRLGSSFDAILVGALGDPRVPGNEHARDILLGMRFQLDLYVNERPARLYSEHLTPLKGKTAHAIDLTIFRENTEGLYVGIGGTFKRGTPDEITIAEEVNSRRGVERIIRHSFAWASERGKTRVTMADKSNAIAAHLIWRRIFDEVGREYPDIRRDAFYVDALALELVRAPETFQVIVTGNLFGDILSDLASGLVGGLGVAPSANRHPGRVAMFEPVHGSAPSLARTERANPMAAMLTLAMALEHMGAPDAGLALERAVMSAIDARCSTPDIGGQQGTREVGDFVAAAVRREGA